MRVSGRRALLTSILAAALAGCGSDTPPAEPATAARPAAPAETSPPVATPEPAQEPPPASVSPADQGVLVQSPPRYDLAGTGGEDPLPFFEIARDTYLLLGSAGPASVRNQGFVSNAGFVVTSAGVVVIDTLASAALAERLRLTVSLVSPQPITHVIVSVHEPEHAGGLAVLGAGAPVQVFAPPARAPDAAPFTRTSLVVGEHTFDLYPIPWARGADALVVHQVDDDILWAGAALYSNGLIATRSPARHRAALEWLQATFADTTLLVPGRGGASDDPAALLAPTLAYLRALEELLPGVGVALADERFGHWRDLPMFDERHPLNLQAALAAAEE